MDLLDKFSFERELSGAIILVLTVDCKGHLDGTCSSEEKAL